VLQAIHHSNDHRTHAGTVLLSHQVEAPDIDDWEYGKAEGACSRSCAMLTPPALHQSRFPMSRLSLTVIRAVSDQLEAIGQLTVIRRRNQLAGEGTQIG
jgi:hypothetical protein